MNIDRGVRARETCASLNPAMLIGATINPDGNIDLCVVEGGTAIEGAGIEFCLGEDGQIYQQRYWIFGSEDEDREIRRAARSPLRMLDLAIGLDHAFGTRTPILFRLKKAGESRPRLAFPGPQSDRARMKILHDAFAIQLVAYEERLI